MLRKLFKRLTEPMSEVDLAKLRDFCKELPVVPIGSAAARQEVTVAGEISSVRIVPRAGSPSLEATVSDGTGSIVAVWTGRRHLAGVCPGRRVMLSGRGADQNGNGRLVVLNPLYELL